MSGIRNLSPQDFVKLLATHFQARWPDVDPASACFYWARLCCELCPGATFQAGNFSLQVRHHRQPGATHYSYVFDPVKATSALSRKLLPEVHCWAILPGGIAVDPTLPFQLSRAATILDIHPDFKQDYPALFKLDASFIQSGVVGYEALPNATALLSSISYA